MNYFVMFIGGILGIFLWSLFKIRSINKRLNSFGLSNQTYSGVFAAFWKYEWVSFMISIVMIFIFMFVSSEYLDLKANDETPIGLYGTLLYKVSNFIKTTSVLVGFCSNALSLTIFGVTEKKLRDKAKSEGVTDDVNL
jgi:hypothetical protein